MEKEELIDLVQRSQDGDMEAFEKLLLHAHTSVSYQCRKMLKNEQDAEDMTQEVLVAVYQKLDTLKEPAAFNKWLHQITASRCINALARTHVEFQIAEDEDGHSMLDTLEEMDEKKIPDKWLDTKETTRMIEEIVDGLPEVQRMCTLMFYYSELSVKEISRIMKVSENTIKSRLNYARKAIKERVLDYEKKGVKLYGLSPLPFLYYFLHKRKEEDKDPVAAQIMVDEILAQSAFVAAGVVNAAGSAAAGSSGTAAVTETIGLAGMLGALPTKVIAGITAALVAIGGITVAATAGDDSRQEPSSPTVVREEQGGGSGQEELLLLDDTDASESTTAPEPEETLPEESEAIESSGSDDSSEDSSQDAEETHVPEPTTPEEDSSENSATTHTHEYIVTREWEPCCCQHQGYTQKTCTLCGDIITTDFVDPLPHTYTATVVAPTAYSQGYTIYNCPTCVETYTDSYTDKLPADSDTADHTHNFTSTVTLQNTCHGEGVMTYACESCDYSYTEVLPKTEHSWVREENLAEEPTCLSVGYEGYGCELCHYAKPDDVIPALGHDYTSTVVAPTETERGYTEFTCNRCGVSFKDNYTEMLPDGSSSSHTHSYTTVVTAPTCTTEGYTTYSCACGHSYTTDYVAPYWHDGYVSSVTPPTCQEDGYTTYTCAICGKTYTDDITAATGHSYTSVVTPPTCQEDGYTTYTCTTCGDTYTSDITAATGHSYTSNVIAPTETEQGYTEYTCTVCGDSYRDSYTDALGAAE